MMPQALTRGAQATRRPDHKLSPTVALHKWRPRINNVNAHLRQNQWPDFRVNTGEGSLILEVPGFQRGPGFSKPGFSKPGLQNQVFKTLAIEISNRMQPDGQHPESATLAVFAQREEAMRAVFAPAGTLGAEQCVQFWHGGMQSRGPRATRAIFAQLG
jgi:hypothetical protein